MNREKMRQRARELAENSHESSAACDELGAEILEFVSEAVAEAQREALEAVADCRNALTRVLTNGCAREARLAYDCADAWLIAVDRRIRALSAPPASERLGPNHRDGCDGASWRYSGSGYNRVRVCACGAEDHAPEPAPQAAEAETFILPRDRMVDADVLDRAAVILAEMGWHETSRRLDQGSRQLRSAPPAAESAPDVFEQVAQEWQRTPYVHGAVLQLAALLRERFSELVEFAESIEATSELYPALGAEASAALRQLRARAEAGGTNAD